MDGGVPAQRRRDFARGYLTLGLIGLAAQEMQALSDAELEETDSLAVLIDLEMERKAWGLVTDLARDYVSRRPKDERGWISWAYALRELQRIEEARVVLLKAEPLHGAKCALLHYNLSCYYCLLGDKVEARLRLDRAIVMDESFASLARDDSDLAGLFD